MRLKIGVILVLLMVAEYSHAQQFDANAPGQKPMTVGSEIARGASAIYTAHLNSNRADVIGESGAFSRIIELNQQVNADTDGFLLGANFEAWRLMAVLVAGDKEHKEHADQQKAREYGKRYFENFRALQRQFNVDDVTLCALTKRDYEVVKRYLDAWSHSK